MTDAIVTPAVPTPRVPAGAPASRQDLRTGDGRELAVVLPAEQPRRHSAQVRGLALLSDDAPKGLTEAAEDDEVKPRFGRLFPVLPPLTPSDPALRILAQAMVAKADPIQDEKDLGEDDEDENPTIPAGYTYLGQFIDHDITFDPVSSLTRESDPFALRDFRTPRFDLDSLYGKGPADQPYMYAADQAHLTLGDRVDDPVFPGTAAFAGPDLPRFRGHALVGDPRNDENLVVSQLHVAFVKFHNRVVDTLATQEPGLTGLDLFHRAQTVVRRHYQWVVVHDFLPTVVGAETAAAVLTGGPGGGPDLRYYRPTELPGEYTYMPVEFSVAAYRFGHSMVRPSYFFNDLVAGATRAQHEADPHNAHLRTPIFSVPGTELGDLNGFRPLPKVWGFQWKYFLPDQGEAQPGLPQPSYKIDATISDPLGNLPLPVAADPPHSLAERNLRRGKALGLPSGQDVARAMGVTPLSDAQLGLDAAGLTAALAERDLANVIGPDAIKATADELAGRAPLWYYVLKEAEVLADARHLGPVGGRIVAEVLVGLLVNDTHSYLNEAPDFTPTLPATRKDAYTIADVVAFGTGVLS